jgi:ribonuclease P protein component
LIFKPPPVLGEAMRHRFPKSARLARAAEFDKVKHNGVSCHGRFMVLSVLKNSPSTETKVGLITSRRVGGAVQRNRVRRRFREIVRMARPDLLPALWLVLIAKKGAVEASFQSLQHEWLQLARKASILTSPS